MFSFFKKEPQIDRLKFSQEIQIHINKLNGDIKNIEAERAAKKGFFSKALLSIKTNLFYDELVIKKQKVSALQNLNTRLNDGSLRRDYIQTIEDDFRRGLNKIYAGFNSTTENLFTKASLYLSQQASQQYSLSNAGSVQRHKYTI